jgi:ABC-type multidrug transport system fused ATPase/permease subunit
LLHLLAPRWRLVTATLACMTVAAATTTAYAWIAGPLLRALYATSSGTPLPGWVPVVGALDTLEPAEATILLGGVVAATSLVRAAANYGQTLLVARLSQDVVTELRLTLYAHLLRLSPAALLGQRRGELGTRIASEVRRVQQLIQMGLAGPVRNGITVLSLGILAFSLDPPLAALGLAGAPAIAVAVYQISKKSRKAYAESWQAEASLSGRVTESAHLLDLLRAFEAEPHARASFAEHAEQARARALDAAALRARVQPAMEMLGALGLVGAIGLAAVRLEQGQLTPEACVSLFAALILLYAPVRSLGSMLHNFVGGLATLDRVEALLQLETRDASHPARDAAPLGPMRRELVFEDVSFRYPGGEPVLEHVDFRVAAGESVALVGPSGSGKTTVLLLAMGLLEPDEGRIRIDGRDLRHVPKESVRRQFGWVSQEPLLFRATVLENIALGRPLDREAARRAAEAADAHPFISHLPEGYDTVLEEDGANLSFGERQRLSIARALYRDAPILVLDEPTAALDGHAEHEVGATIDSLLGPHTVLVASHRERTVQRADRVLVLSEGRIVQQGPPEELGNREGTYRLLFAG